ncbi:MAG TPA: PIN domain-containing protein [Rhodothermales bacterium]|nr:PIN domain-containing protein [Rhodothermales bacterium]
MKADFRVFLDACVLANYGVCDLLLRLAERPRQYLPLWSEDVLGETYRTHTERLGWPEGLAASFGRELRAHFPEALTSGYAHLLPAVTNDLKDRHVLAAAIHAGADVILTFNLKDFPDEALAPWGIAARHPQDYLLTLYEMDGKQVVSRVAAIAAKRGLSQEDVLLRLGKSLPAFATRLLDDLRLG